MARFWRRRPADHVQAAKPAPVTPTDTVQARPTPAGIIDHLEEGILLLNGTQVRWLNAAARMMFAAHEHPVGRPLVEVVRDHRIDALALRARESGLEQAAEVELPWSARIFQVRAVPLQDGDIVLLVRDMTRLRYLETVRQQFVANLSHEMRTPLAGLDLAAQTLSAQLPPGGDTRLFIDRISQEAKRLADIVFNLNQLAALDAEEISVERTPFSVDYLVRSLIDRYQARASAGELLLRAETMADGLIALGDRAKTDQALQNIVDNALKFTRAGEVVVMARLDRDRVEIAIRDTGPGIPVRDISRIFERFYKVDRSRSGLPGSGLGLSIARHLVELQGGTIVAESNPGAGTIVRVRLPRAPLTSA
ncbi:MAG: HAMP domain-containing histidine kinase [Candidatus Dormibacteraeota bacterium]|nr:HAMP domain-containing histidine kinase [Candidatus Dormibacteraeota bacterium]